MRRPFRIFVFLLMLASFAPGQDRNKVVGAIFNGGAGSSNVYKTDQQSKPLEGMLVESFDADKKQISSNKTDKEGKFVLIVPPNVGVFRILAYDPDGSYWIFSPEGQLTNSSERQDLGKIYLYPRTTKLTRDQVRQQIAGAQVLEQVDKEAANGVTTDVLAKYPGELRSEIQNALNSDPELKPQKIKVKVSGQEVSLTGDVDSPGQKYKAHQIATDHAAGIDVKNHIEVKAAK